MTAEVTNVYLKTGECIIGFVDELPVEPSCHINQPYQITKEVTHEADLMSSLKKWPKYTNEEDIILHTDSILTMCEPKEDIRLAYLLRVKPNVLEKPDQEPILLQEEPVDPMDDIDDTFYVETGIDGMI